MELNEARSRRWLRPEVALTVLAIVAGTGGAWLGGQYLASRADAAEADLAARYQGRQVVVASTDVAAGAVLTPQNMAVRSVPAEFLPPDAVAAEEASDLLGGTAAIALSRGTPILRGALLAAAPAPRLAAVLAPDERALTLSVDDLDSQAGALRAGDRIDLYYGQREGDDAVLVPLLQQVEILGTGTSFQAGAPDLHFATVTLRVNAEDAPRVLLARDAGELSVLLRGPDDTRVLPVAMRRGRELLRGPLVAGPARAQMELLIGGAGEQVPQRRMITVGAGRIGEAS